MSDHVIEIENLKKSFGEKKVLNGTDLCLEKGENLVVLGKSGTGKSVLIKCIVNLITPDEGKIEVLGKNMYEISDKERDKIRRQIGFVFQSAALYDSMSVRENLAFPLRRNKISKQEIEERTMKALANVGLEDAVDKMPSELSGGMRKRIGLARTIIINPSIMLYDEPTTGLDAITSGEISDLILEIQEKYKTSSMIITHDMACARLVSNRIVMLREGKFTAEGSYDELAQSDDRWVSAFFEQG